MMLILLKSSACLAVFMLFYKLCLEKTSAHIFKRFYLIAVILTSISIPFNVFTEYVETEPVNLTIVEDYSMDVNPVAIESKSFQEYMPTILWSIYVLGVILFSIRFFKNLYHIVQKIKANPKYKNKNYINVLLVDLMHPHTFFNYIFLDKNKYEHNLIPTEVLLHEQTHAKQKHALDILFIEILQILFWFNPLLYFIKKDIKLNHEFLADQAVINKGANTKRYQQLLLAFSSNASHHPLANAINYSLIKKRFTVMKTKTSKTAIWFRSLLLLPLLAITLYSFSEKIIVEKAPSVVQSNLNQQVFQKILIIMNFNEELLINDENKTYKVSELKSKLNSILYNSSKEQKEATIIDLRVDAEAPNQAIKNVKSILRDLGLNKITFSQKYTSTATEEEVAEYNKLAKYYNSQPKNNLKVDLLDLKRLESIYQVMTSKQKEKAEPFIIQQNITKKEVPEPLFNHLPLQNQDSIIEVRELKPNEMLTILISEKGNLKVNNFNLKISALSGIIGGMTYSLSEEEKNKLNTQITFHKKTPKETIIKVKDILRKNGLLQINQNYKTNKLTLPLENTKATPEQITEYNSLLRKYEKIGFINTREWTNMRVIYSINMSPSQREENKKYPKTMKGDPEILKLNITREDVKNNPEIITQIKEYNKLAKKYNSNPKGVFKAKDIKRVIALYNLMSDEHKKGAEPFPKFTTPPAIPENATPEEIKAHNKKYDVYKEITKDLKQ